MATLELGDGTYKIHSYIDSDGFIGRNEIQALAEVNVQAPEMEPVVIHPFGSSPKKVSSRFQATSSCQIILTICFKLLWNVEKILDGKGGYWLRIIGTPTYANNNLIFALLTQQTLEERWNIRPQPRYGNNVYT
jgi:hypothetical protein